MGLEGSVCGLEAGSLRAGVQGQLHGVLGPGCGPDGLAGPRVTPGWVIPETSAGAGGCYWPQQPVGLGVGPREACGPGSLRGGNTPRALRGLKEQQVIVLPPVGSQVHARLTEREGAAMIKVWQAWFLLERPGECPFLSQLPEALPPARRPAG